MENVITPSERKVVYLKLDDILPNRFQPRIKFDEQALNELSQSIKEHGVLSPITVRPLGNKYEIIAGERRYKASVIAGLTDIPALIVKMDDKESAEIALIENVQRKDLTPIEEAISYKKIFDMNIGISQEALAKKLGKSQSAIANKLRLLNLSDEVQEALLENKISERHARSLLKIKDKKIQNKMLNKIMTERMTVRKTDEEIINMLNNNKDVEILDFELENQEIRTEKINDPLNRFEGLYNLPKTQIIEDKEDEFIPNIPDVLSIEEVTSLPESKKVADNIEGTIQISRDEINEMLKKQEPKEEAINNINPGFLDITKIEKEASNINSSPSKISLEELLKMPNDTIESNNQLVSEENNVVVPDFSKNKFFTMIEDDDKVTFEPKVQETVPTQEIKENDNHERTKNPFELNFDTKFVPQEPTIFDNINKLDDIKISEAPKEELSFDSAIFDNNLDFGNIFNNQETKTTEQVVQVPTQEEPTIESKKEEFDFGEISQDIPQFNYGFDLTTAPIIEEKEEELPVVSNLEINEEVKNLTPTSSFDYTPIYDMNENTSYSNNVEANDELQSVFQVQPLDYTPVYEIEEEQEDIQHLDNSKYGAADLKTIINTIRKCAETIEKYGYVIDTEEFDFEDMYQVIFKVQKKQ